MSSCRDSSESVNDSRGLEAMKFKTSTDRAAERAGRVMGGGGFLSSRVGPAFGVARPKYVTYDRLEIARDFSILQQLGWM